MLVLPKNHSANVMPCFFNIPCDDDLPLHYKYFINMSCFCHSLSRYFSFSNVNFHIHLSHFYGSRCTLYMSEDFQHSAHLCKNVPCLLKTVTPPLGAPTAGGAEVTPHIIPFMPLTCFISDLDELVVPRTTPFSLLFWKNVCH